MFSLTALVLIALVMIALVLARNVKKLAPAQKIAQIYLPDLPLFASLEV